MDISVVIPLLNEEESLPELTRQIEAVMQEHRFGYEIIFVDDGSTDDSWKVIEGLYEHNRNIRGIKFRRNYGKSAALNEGFKAAKGDVVITMDADLQDKPELIPDFLVRHRAGLAGLVPPDGGRTAGVVHGAGPVDQEQGLAVDPDVALVGEGPGEPPAVALSISPTPVVREVVRGPRMKLCVSIFALMFSLLSSPAFAQAECWTDEEVMRRNPNPSREHQLSPWPSHRIIDNVYYVGSKGLASFLITTPEGLT